MSSAARNACCAVRALWTNFAAATLGFKTALAWAVLLLMFCAAALPAAVSLRASRVVRKACSLASSAVMLLRLAAPPARADKWCAAPSTPLVKSCVLESSSSARLTASSL
jgi:hypothetical protein